MIVLPDTSVWVEYLRHGTHGEAGELDRLLQENSVVVCGPVAAELLSGTRSEDRDHLWFLLWGLPWAPLNPPEWRRVGNLAAALRAQGAAVPLTDLEIAVAAETFNASVWTRDKDFSRIVAALPSLQLYRPSSVPIKL